MASNDEERSVTTIFTTAGQSLATQVQAGKTTVKFTKADISTTNRYNDSVTEIQVLTSLDNVQQTAEISNVAVINDTTVDVQISIDQTKAPNDYQMNSLGLYAADGDGKEILYSVTVLKDPVYVHQDATGSALSVGLETVVGNSQSVKFDINPAGAVTNEVFKATLADYVTTEALKGLLPKTLADTAKDNAFTGANSFAQAPTDGDGNPYITNKDAQAKVDAGVKTAASDAQTKATAAQTAAEKYADSLTQGVQLSSGTDLYTLLDGEKKYFVNSNSTAASMINSPTTSAFALTTRTISEGSGDGDKNWKITALSIRDLTGKQWHAVIATDGSGKQQIDVPWALDPTDDAELLHTKDAVNFQKPPVTAPDGTGYIMVNAGEDMYAKIAASSMGFHTIYVNASAVNNPTAGADSMRGTVYVDVSGKLWSASLISFSGVTYHIMQNTTVTAPIVEKLVSANDTANWQHVKLTADDGSAEYFWRDPTLSLPNQILSLPLGMHTFFAVSGMKDAPALSTGGSFRGMVHISSSDLIGTGYMVNSVTGDMWSIAVANHAVAFEKLASDADTVKDNHNETVTVNGVSYTMVDKNNVLLINPATSEVTQVPKFVNGIVLGTHTLTITDADGLCIDGLPIDIIVADEATAASKAAADHLHRYVTVEDDTGATS